MPQTVDKKALLKATAELTQALNMAQHYTKQLEVYYCKAAKGASVLETYKSCTGELGKLKSWVKKARAAYAKASKLMEPLDRKSDMFKLVWSALMLAHGILKAAEKAIAKHEKSTLKWFKALSKIKHK